MVLLSSVLFSPGFKLRLVRGYPEASLRLNTLMFEEAEFAYWCDVFRRQNDAEGRMFEQHYFYPVEFGEV